MHTFDNQFKITDAPIFMETEKLQDSPHVAHFRTDPKKYRAACLEHVHRIEQAEAWVMRGVTKFE